jgi:hypothetical protein
MSQKKSARTIADPATLLAAAEKAPKVFHIAAYFRPIYVMREKGYSWRQLEKWLGEFGIKISAVHLRRLFVQEYARLDALTAAQLAAEGLPEDFFADDQKQRDPTDRLRAGDPEDFALEEARKKLLMEAGVSQEEFEGTDFTQPVTVGGRTL